MEMYAHLLQPLAIDIDVKSEMLTHNNRSVPAFDSVITCSRDKKQLALFTIPLILFLSFCAGTKAAASYTALACQQNDSGYYVHFNPVITLK